MHIMQYQISYKELYHIRPNGVTLSFACFGSEPQVYPLLSPLYNHPFHTQTNPPHGSFYTKCFNTIKLTIFWCPLLEHNLRNGNESKFLIDVSYFRPARVSRVENEPSSFEIQFGTNNVNLNGSNIGKNFLNLIRFDSLDFASGGFFGSPREIAGKSFLNKQQFQNRQFMFALN